jgi:hypothetical protein
LSLGSQEGIKVGACSEFVGGERCILAKGGIREGISLGNVQGNTIDLESVGIRELKIYVSAL